MLYEKAKRESERLNRKIEKIRNELAAMPKGKLHIVHDRNAVRWYNYLGNNIREYLNNSNIGLVRQLARKHYLSLLLKDLEHEKRAVDSYLRHHVELPWKSEQLLSNEDYLKLLYPLTQTKNQEYHDWAKEPYPRNLEYSKNLKFKIPNGQLVRSKSEALIAMILFKYNIPFRYECALEIDGMIIYPDFTIRHPETGEFYYLEHLGRFDDPKYRLKNCNRIHTYGLKGIYPSFNLLLTYETDDKPLDIEKVEKMIKEYFVDD